MPHRFPFSVPLVIAVCGAAAVSAFESGCVVLGAQAPLSDECVVASERALRGSVPINHPNRTSRRLRFYVSGNPDMSSRRVTIFHSGQEVSAAANEFSSMPGPAQPPEPDLVYTIPSGWNTPSRSFRTGTTGPVFTNHLLEETEIPDFRDPEQQTELGVMSSLFRTGPERIFGSAGYSAPPLRRPASHAPLRRPAHSAGVDFGSGLSAGIDARYADPSGTVFIPYARVGIDNVFSRRKSGKPMGEDLRVDTDTSVSGIFQLGMETHFYNNARFEARVGYGAAGSNLDSWDGILSWSVPF